MIPGSEAPASSSGSYIEPIDGTVASGGIVTFIGDSITYGFDASPRLTARWTSLLSAGKGWTEDNQGLSGYPLCQSASVCNVSFIPKSLIPNKTTNNRFLFIAAGNNDIQITGQGSGTNAVTPAFYKATLIDWVNTAVSQGWNPHRIIMISPCYADFTAGSFVPCNTDAIDTQRRLDFVQATMDAAAASGAFAIDVYHPMQATGGDAWLTPIGGGPGIHPITAGHAFMYSVIGPYFN